MDVEIAQSITQNLEPWSTAWQSLQPGELLRADAYQKLLPHYTSAVWNYAVSRDPFIFRGISDPSSQRSMVSEWKPPRPFVYTPLHGVGGLVFPSLCRSTGISDFVTVAAQEQPDPDFPTVAFPNPEEAGALDLAMQIADHEGKTLIIANDPDADRFAMAEKVE